MRHSDVVPDNVTIPRQIIETLLAQCKQSTMWAEPVLAVEAFVTGEQRVDEASETTAGLLEQAIAYLYDKHQLVLYRINQPHGDGGLSPDEVGWMFAEKGLANPSVQGLTIEDAAIATFEQIRTANRERQIKTQRELEDTMGIASWCNHHLDVLAGEGRTSEDDDDDVDPG